MKIITQKPIITVSSQEELDKYMEEFASIDGSNDVQVKHFQLFANSKGEKLKVNGKWDAQTRTAYAKHGAAWEKVFSEQYPNYTISAPDGKKRLGHFWDKVKNVWVAANNLGLFGTNFQTQNQEEFLPPPPPPEPEQKSILPVILVISGLALIGYFVYKSQSKK